MTAIHQEPSVAKYISVSDCYFRYVTETRGVIYYKILCDGIPAGGLHTEKADGTMYLSICIDEKYRRKGIAETSLNRLLLTQEDVNRVEVSIDKDNIPSVLLFEKLGFRQIAKEEELILLQKVLP